MATNTYRIFTAHLKREYFFHAHFVFPLVAEVVLVQKPLVETEPQRAKGYRTSIMCIDKTLDPWDGKVFFAETKAVEMKVRRVPPAAMLDVCRGKPNEP